MNSDIQGEKETMVAESLFGSVRRPAVVGDLPPPAQELLEPLDDEDYALRFFCSGCGTLLPVLKTALAEVMGSQPDSYEGKYLSVQRCDHCSDGFSGQQLVPLPKAS